MNRKTLGILLFAAALIAAVYGWNEFNRGAADANELPVKETVGAQELFDAFLSDESAATERFVGTKEQVIQVNGTIRGIEKAGPNLTNVILATTDDMAAVVCEFDEGAVPSAWIAGKDVSVKGICTGMLLDVILVRCVAAE